MQKFQIKIFILLLLLFVTNLQAQNTEAYSRLDTNAIIIGDQIGLELGIKLPLGFISLWPAFGDTITENIEIISRSGIDTIFGEDQMTLSQLLTITSFDSGYFEVPEFNFIYGKEGDSLIYSSKSQKLFLNVYTPEVDTSQAFKVIKAPYAEPYTFMEIFPWVLGGLAIIALIAFIIWFIIRRKKNKPVFASKPKPLRPPQEVALEKLETLRREKMWQQGRLKKYHSQLTDIAREYIDRRFNFDAPEMTSEEIIGELGKHKVNKEVMGKISATFQLSDLVKFAKAQPTALDNDLSYSHCVDFVNETAIAPQSPTIDEAGVESIKKEGGQHV